MGVVKAAAIFRDFYPIVVVLERGFFPNHKLQTPPPFR
ncbi:MAG: hypothetical protein JWQ78_120, partial [Sediminibacterium sp.]|nr:hypothetical protein [Sediminibacterium sp.]